MEEERESRKENELVDGSVDRLVTVSKAFSTLRMRIGHALQDSLPEMQCGIHFKTFLNSTKNLSYYVTCLQK